MESAVVQASFADLRIAKPRPSSLRDRIVATLEYYPCDLLFIHRDAEREPSAARRSEIEQAINEAQAAGHAWVPVIPVRMTEAWLMVDESAIRMAADNPRGTAPLELPSINNLENLPDPKAVLREALERACEKQGRRLQKFRQDMSRHVQRVGEVLSQFDRLRALTAFRQLEADSRVALVELGFASVES